ncbi:hypothetical protein ACLVWU_17785 [Bdellovibrio sp. HCB290]|uniref:hypothetical protein n=1 Tax=Bdellovibrio sp. HCB290 TaxID=3394356 RepID=UPI0039B364BA
MKNSLRLVSLVAISMLAFGCAHHRDVRPSASGDHKVLLNIEDKEAGYRDAMSQAEDYCKQSGRMPVIVNEGSKYQGNMDEGTYQKAKTASKVAQAAGGAIWAMGGQTESAVGGIAGLGGSVARGALGNGYRYELVFRCQ